MSKALVRMPTRFWVAIACTAALLLCSHAIQSWHYFRPPTEDEFWVVSLHQVATIHNVELTNNGTHKRRTSLTANTVTVVQPFSLGRVSALPVLCTAWDGPVSIALYVPLSESGNVYLPKNTMLHNATVQEAQQYIEQLVHQLPGCKEDVEVLHVVQAHTWFLPPTSGKCSMQVVMVTETLPSNTTLLDEDYYTIPINALRNIALEHAPSEMVMLLDGDFIPGPPSLHKQLRQLLPTLRADMQQHGTLLVLPAFDVQVPWQEGPGGLPVFPEAPDVDTLLQHMFMENETDGSGVPVGKAAVLGALSTGYVQPFQINYHSSTDYDQWASAVGPYAITGREGYEPYVLALKSSLPRWDERFRGYFYNKIVYMFGLHVHDGRPYVVLPQAYVLHLHHPKLSLEIAGSRAMYFKLKEVWENDVRLSIINKTYVAVAAEHTRMEQ